MRRMQQALAESLAPVSVLAICAVGLVAAGLLGADPQTQRQTKTSRSSGATNIGAPGISDWRARLTQKWQPQPAADKPLTRIGFGSCLHQRYPQPIWQSVIAARPETFVMMGDNVYGDVKSPDLRELVSAYAAQSSHEGFAAARAAMPFLATWDDHDYAKNDGGADFKFRDGATRVFETFWKGSGTLETVRGPGIAYARTFGPEGQRVQFLMLDTRSFRSPLKRKPKGTPGRGKYVPDDTANKTMLGTAQWSWLKEQLGKPADLRIIVSGIQVIAEGHGWERWGNLPRERAKLYELIKSTKANGVVFASGDRHRASIYRNKDNGPYPLYELTSSSLNRSFDDPAENGPHQLGPMYGESNFGMIEINWPERRIVMTIRGPDGQPVRSRKVDLAELKISG